MPELAEVEVVRRRIESQLPPQPWLSRITFRRKDLRFPIPIPEIEALVGAKLQCVARRAKYLLFHFEGAGILSHLGMSGYWRKRLPGEEFLKHDHLIIEFNNSIEFIYNDPRRFGILDFFQDPDQHKLLSNLGYEALDAPVQAEELYRKFRKRVVSAKSALLDQRLIAGLGNIYVNEILFAAKVSPFRKTSRLTRAQVQSLCEHGVRILNEAITSGGSSIRDFRHLDVEKGGFQERFQVYGRQGLECLKCHQPIKVKQQNARATYWCRSCQR